jgi:protein phosphatase
MFKNYTLCDQGLKRSNNEDAILESSSLVIVSDGMGGHEKGEVASEIVVKTFQRDFLDEKTVNIDQDTTIPVGENFDEKEVLKGALTQTVFSCVDQIVHYTNEHAIKNTIGATVVGLIESEEVDDLAVFHLGDSRAYLIRDEDIVPLTVDHSTFEQMRASGKYSEEELSKVGKNKITKAIGNFQRFEPEVHFITPEENDVYLLCSDGVSDLCSDEELLDIVLKNVTDYVKATDEIKEVVYSKGAKDNLSVIISEFFK